MTTDTLESRARALMKQISPLTEEDRASYRHDLDKVIAFAASEVERALERAAGVVGRERANEEYRRSRKRNPAKRDIHDYAASVLCDVYEHIRALKEEPAP